MRIRRPLCLACLIFVLLVAGCAYRIKQPEIPLPEDGANIVLTGTVESKEYKILHDSKVLVLYLDSISVKGEETGKISGKDTGVMCCLTGTDNQKSIPRIGETIQVCGRVSLFREAANPGEFDFREYYQILNISYRLNQTEILKRSHSYFPLKEWLFQLKCRCDEILDDSYPAKEASVLKAMLLGEKSFLEEETKELYRLNGLLHILSISGLHISLLGMGLYGLLKKCGIPVVLRAPVVIAVMWCYGIMSGMGISTWRAVLMFGLRLAAELLGRTYDMLTGLALAAALMLAGQPILVRHSGFLLSFGAVFGIAVVLPWWSETVKGLTGRGGEKKEKEETVCGKWKKNITEAFLFNTAIAITTLPVLLRFYYVYPVYSLLLNCYVIPLMSLVLAAGMMSVGAGFFSPGLAALSGWPVRGVLWLYEFSCQKALELPGNLRIKGQPSGWQIAVYYGVLLLLVLRPGSGKKRTPVSLPPLAAWFAVLGITQLLLLRPALGFTAYFLDVGQGDCIVMVNGNGKCYMVDGGSTSKSQVGKYQILPFLESKGIGELEAVFLTHPDEDHISGVLELTDQSAYGVKIKAMILPDTGEEMKEEALLPLRRRAAEKNIPVYYIGKGDSLRDGNLRLICLGPEKGILTEEVNEISTVLCAEYGDFRMLLTGDVTGEPERELLEEGKELNNLTVLKVAHHGSRYSTPEELLELTNPVYAVISAGEGNRYGHPHEELLERLENTECNILITAETGAVWFWTDGKKIRAETFREVLSGSF